jgi:hypothetical protein
MDLGHFAVRVLVLAGCLLGLRGWPPRGQARVPTPRTEAQSPAPPGVDLST